MNHTLYIVKLFNLFLKYKSYLLVLNIYNKIPLFLKMNHTITKYLYVTSEIIDNKIPIIAVLLKIKFLANFSVDG